MWHNVKVVVFLSSPCKVKVFFFFSRFHSFLSEPGGQPTGRQGCREVFSSNTWVRETDGACPTRVCGFIQIYDGRKWDWMWAGREVRGGGNWRQKGQLSVKSWKSLGGEGVPAQWCYCMNWLCFILAHCCVFCHLLRRASLPSHWTPLHPSQDSELSFRLLDWHLLRLLYHKGNLFYFPVIWVPWSLHYY